MVAQERLIVDALRALLAALIERAFDVIHVHAGQLGSDH